VQQVKKEQEQLRRASQKDVLLVKLEHITQEQVILHVLLAKLENIIQEQVILHVRLVKADTTVQVEQTTQHVVPDIKEQETVRQMLPKDVLLVKLEHIQQQVVQHVAHVKLEHITLEQETLDVQRVQMDSSVQVEQTKQHVVQDIKEQETVRKMQLKDVVLVQQDNTLQVKHQHLVQIVLPDIIHLQQEKLHVALVALEHIVMLGLQDVQHVQQDITA
jgi:hypothetical protein